MNTVVAHNDDKKACLYFINACLLGKLSVFLTEDMLRMIWYFCTHSHVDLSFTYMRIGRLGHCKTVPVLLALPPSFAPNPFQIEMRETVLYEPYKLHLKSYMTLTMSEKLCSLFDCLDAQNIRYGVHNSRELFGRLLDEQTIRDRYVPLKSCWHTFRVNVDSCTRVSCRVDANKIQQGQISNIRKGVEVRLHACTLGIWIVPQRFGMSFYAKEVLVMTSMPCLSRID